MGDVIVADFGNGDDDEELEIFAWISFDKKETKIIAVGGPKHIRPCIGFTLDQMMKIKNEMDFCDFGEDEISLIRFVAVEEIDIEEITK